MLKLKFKIILSLFALVLSLLIITSCGGGGGSSGLGSLENISTTPTPSEEFLRFVNQSKQKSYDQFVIDWNNQKNNWVFSYYGEHNLTWPDYSSSEEIYNSKVINCYRISKLLQYIYGGELIKVDQTGQSNYDHYYLLLPNGDIINNNGTTLSYRVK
jgi:hypothetical protein